MFCFVCLQTTEVYSSRPDLGDRPLASPDWVYWWEQLCPKWKMTTWICGDYTPRGNWIRGTPSNVKLHPLELWNWVQENKLTFGLIQNTKILEWCMHTRPSGKKEAFRHLKAHQSKMENKSQIYLKVPRNQQRLLLPTAVHIRQVRPNWNWGII